MSCTRCDGEEVSATGRAEGSPKAPVEEGAISLSGEDNITAVRRHYKIWSHGDLSVGDEIWAKEIVFCEPHQARSTA